MITYYIRFRQFKHWMIDFAKYYFNLHAPSILLNIVANNTVTLDDTLIVMREITIDDESIETNRIVWFLQNFGDSFSQLKDFLEHIHPQPKIVVFHYNTENCVKLTVDLQNCTYTYDEVHNDIEFDIIPFIEI